MAEFNIGDKVVRQEHYRDGQWAISCAQNDRAADEVFTVESAVEGAISLCGVGGVWDAFGFRLATGLEEHQSVGLPAEDRLREANAHIECLREKIAGLESELRKCCGTVADKPNLEKVVKQLSDEVTELHSKLAMYEMDEESLMRQDSLTTQLAEITDQRDAAVLAAKSLGDEVQKLREDRRELRLNYKALDGLLSSLDHAVADIDLQQLSRQLGQIGEMADEQGNGADAKMCFDSAQVVDFVQRVLADWHVGQDE